MDRSLGVQLLLGLGTGIVVELLFEAVLPGAARRLRQVWWLTSLSRSPGWWLLLPLWLLAVGAVWWGMHAQFTSGPSVVLFMVLPAMAAAVTVWRLSQPARFRRSGRASG